MKASSLAGDLSEFPLTDIIQLVDLGKKTGAVQIEGRRGMEHITGRIYFRDGRIIGAEAADLPPLEAAYLFFTVASGPFEFLDGVIIDHPTITASNEMIIMEGIMRQDAWENTPATEAPPLEMIPRLIPNPASSTNEINLEAEEWRVLTMVNGKNTVGQIAQRSGLGEYRARQIIGDLLQNGLIEERSTQPAEMVQPELERIAASVVGPNAAQLVQEAYVRANITDPSNASSQQIAAAINQLEQSLISLVGVEQGIPVAEEMRNRARELLH